MLDLENLPSFCNKMCHTQLDNKQQALPDSKISEIAHFAHTKDKPSHPSTVTVDLKVGLTS